MKNIYITLACTVLLTACAGNAPVVRQNTPYLPEQQARIRLYGQNQKPTIMTANIDCASKGNWQKVNVGGSMGDAFGSFVGTAKSHSIGIPETETSRNIGKKNGLLSKAVFREFAIQAGKPVNVSAAYIGLTTVSQSPQRTVIFHEGSCRSATASFVPQAGRDYEVIGLKGRGCGVAVYEISANGHTSPIALSDEFRCRKQ